MGSMQILAVSMINYTHTDVGGGGLGGDPPMDPIKEFTTPDIVIEIDLPDTPLAEFSADEEVIDADVDDDSDFLQEIDPVDVPLAQMTSSGPDIMLPALMLVALLTSMTAITIRNIFTKKAKIE